MRPVFQQDGDRQCLRAAVASLFELPLEDVPFFGGRTAFDEEARARGLHSINQDRDLAAWLQERGLALQYACPDAEGNILPLGPVGLCLAYGPTIRGTTHAVVWDADKNTLAHDPHPSGAGLIQPNTFVLFIVRDPARLAAARGQLA